MMHATIKTVQCTGPRRTSLRRYRPLKIHATEDRSYRRYSPKKIQVTVGTGHRRYRLQNIQAIENSQNTYCASIDIL
jgi:hypothetical protein